MRGTKMGLVRGAVFIGAVLVIASPGLAQNDPRVPVTFRQQVPIDTCDPTTNVCSGGKVSQSRTFKNKTFQSQVQYKQIISNATTNDLNRVFAELTVSNVSGSTPASIDYVVTSLDSSATPPVCTYSNTRDKVRCELGSIAAASTPTQVLVYFVVNVPQDGIQLLASWVAGGYEGNGNGNGCCQPTGLYYTEMIDKTIDQSYKSTLQTFVKKEGTSLFTGDAYIPMPATRNSTGDLNTTFVGVPKIADTYGASGTEIEQFLGTLDESQPICTTANFKGNKCFRSEVTIQKVDFSKEGTRSWFSVDKDLGQTTDDLAGPPDELLDVVLRIDDSAIKGNPALTDYRVKYTETVDGVTSTKDVLPCPVPTPNTGQTLRTDLPATTLLIHKNSLPCHAGLIRWPNNTTPAELKGDLQVNGKHYKNGGWQVE